MRRSEHDRILFGVCAGLANALGLAPIWLRLAFLGLALASGVGILLYIALAIFVPSDATAQLGLLQRWAFAGQRVLAWLQSRVPALLSRLRGRSAPRSAPSPLLVAGALLLFGGGFALAYSFGLYAVLSFAQSAALLAVLVGLVLLSAARAR